VVSRPHIDLQFGNTVGQLAVLARIAMGQPVDPHLDARPHHVVFQPIDPIAVDLGDQNAHAAM
jgi:hypothetical protein